MNLNLDYGATKPILAASEPALSLVDQESLPLQDAQALLQVQFQALEGRTPTSNVTGIDDWAQG
jgi:hypothetical protein